MSISEWPFRESDWRCPECNKEGGILPAVDYGIVGGWGCAWCGARWQEVEHRYLDVVAKITDEGHVIGGHTPHENHRAKAMCGRCGRSGRDMPVLCVGRVVRWQCMWCTVDRGIVHEPVSLWSAWVRRLLDGAEMQRVDEGGGNEL